MPCIVFGVMNMLVLGGHGHLNNHSAGLLDFLRWLRAELWSSDTRALWILIGGPILPVATIVIAPIAWCVVEDRRGVHEWTAAVMLPLVGIAA